MITILADVDVGGRQADVRLVGGRVDEVAYRLSTKGADEVVDGAGGALLPGLHDHHLHLLAAAAALESVPCGPPGVQNLTQLAQALQTAAPARGQVRGINYHESVAGNLDRHELDRLVSDRPVRVQHRSGTLWILNSRAIEALDPSIADAEGAETDEDGQPNGRFWRLDTRLRTTPSAPVLAPIGRALSSYGITGVTDATPELDRTAVALLTNAARSGHLKAEVMLLGSAEPAVGLPPRWRLGPRKLVLDDFGLPSLEALTHRITASHGSGRPVAIHAVSRVSLALALAALDASGVRPGDRIEHGAVVPAPFVGIVAGLGVRVVTQPSFIRMRGDAYLHDVDPDDLSALYPYATLLAAGVRVAPSSDAPYGDLDPWRTIADAAARETHGGRVIGAAERVSPRVALDGFLSSPDDPGGTARRVERGAPADLCLLRLPLRQALAAPRADVVRRTWHARDTI